MLKNATSKRLDTIKVVVKLLGVEKSATLTVTHYQVLKTLQGKVWNDTIKVAYQSDKEPPKNSATSVLLILPYDVTVGIDAMYYFPDYNGTRWSKPHNGTFARIDSASISEIKQYVETELPTIFEYYREEKTGDYTTWSNKLFGRCCTEADLLYSELLEFKVSATTTHKKYPPKNLFDKSYCTAYGFKENEATEIMLSLNRDSESHVYHINVTVDQVLNPKEILLKPFRLSVLNGYVKSEKTFKEHGRVKAIELYLNNTYKSTITLLDTPLVQEFEIGLTFARNDTILLKPMSHYKGTKYNAICISEIQSSLSQTTHPTINATYRVSALFKYGNTEKNK